MAPLSVLLIFTLQKENKQLQISSTLHNMPDISSIKEQKNYEAIG